jgi:2-keto-4-pentenoate hydratase/2-oxohepta-3-ene-1,7-dioic acid hydratase in catechol pathway
MRIGTILADPLTSVALVSRRRAAGAILLLALAVMSAGPAQAQDVTRYVRYETAGTAGYGILAADGATIRVLAGPFLGPDGPTGAGETGMTLARDAVRLLPPTAPRNVIAVGLNYASHIASPADGDVPLFAKLPASLVGDGGAIRLPPDAGNAHYEGEMVLVIGRRARNVTAAQAGDYIFGVTAGNDVSERSWQSRDLQWLRAKASDTFGPVGPAVATGLDWDDLLVETRVDGEVRQSERTTHLIHGVAKIVAYVSRYVTLEPGDLIFTGTPGRTRALSPGETVSVTVEGVGTLTNPVVRGD